MSVPFISNNRFIRVEQYKKQDGLCWFCSEPLDLFLPPNTWGACSWEHVVPKCMGGSDRMSNLVLTHHECNKARADRLIGSFRRPVSEKDMREMQSPRLAQHAFTAAVVRLRKLFKKPKARKTA